MRTEPASAVARRSPDGVADANWHLEQRVSRQQALKMLTIAPAYAAFQENERGSIEAGKAADFTVFSADLMTIPESEILESHVTRTFIAGEQVYSAQQGARPQRASEVTGPGGVVRADAGPSTPPPTSSTGPANR